MEIDILGTPYTIRKGDPKTDRKLEGKGGYIETYSKEIIFDEIKENETIYTSKNIEEYNKNTIRHELTHAFFEESGLREYSIDERLVEWIATQFPKMVKAMTETKCI